ncbi:MAG: ABC transporter substrate-binding protein [Acidimicrobiales bacterium]
MRPAGRARAVLGLLAVAALLAGCPGDDEEGDDRPSTTEERRPTGEIVDGGTMRLGVGGAIVADPVNANLGSPTDLLLLDLLHDGLTRVADDGAVVPALATEWSADPTFTTWTFKLDPQATFASGRGITSADVVASLQRVAKGGDTSLAALKLEGILGFRELVDATATGLAGVTAPDPTTVQIILASSMAALPTLLASPTYGIVDIASLDAVASDAEALGELDLSGDWTISGYDDGVLELARRPGPSGHLDGVEVRAYDDADEAYEAFDEGDVDWALVPVERYGDAVDDHGDDAFAPFHAELFFGMRVSSPSLANVEVRKAIAASIDREAIVRAVYDDLAEPLSAVIPAGVPGHDDDRCGECRHDPERAKSILAAAFPSGGVPTVAIDFDQSPAQEAMAGIVADGLRKAGIPTTLRPKPIEEYKAFVVSGAQELFSFGWIGGYVSGDAYITPLFGSAANDNLTGFGAPEVDLALATARAAGDAAAASGHWGGVEARVLAEAVVVPIAQFRTQAVVGERVQGFEHAVDGSVDWSEVWVSDGE